MLQRYAHITFSEIAPIYIVEVVDTVDIDEGTKVSWVGNNADDSVNVSTSS